MVDVRIIWKISNEVTIESLAQLCNNYTELDFQILFYMHINQVEVTRFEDLEETHAEVKLKQSLWLAQKEWETDHDNWMKVQLMDVHVCIMCILSAHSITGYNNYHMRSA